MYSNDMSARLCFTDEHGQLDYIVLGVRPTRIFGHLKNPLQLRAGEPPPSARCRIHCKDGTWYIENIGQAGLTLVNQVPITVLQLFHGAEIRCGPLSLDFLSLAEVPASESTSAEGPEILALRRTLAEKMHELQQSESLHKEAQSEIRRLDEQQVNFRAEHIAQKEQIDTLMREVASLASELKVSQHMLAEYEQSFCRLEQVLRATRTENARLLFDRNEAWQKEQSALARAKEFEAATRQALADSEQHEQEVAKKAADLAMALKVQHELVTERELLIAARQAAIRTAREAEVERSKVECELSSLRKTLANLEDRQSAGSHDPRSE